MIVVVVAGPGTVFVETVDVTVVVEALPTVVVVETVLMGIEMYEEQSLVAEAPPPFFVTQLLTDEQKAAELAFCGKGLP